MNKKIYFLFAAIILIIYLLLVAFAFFIPKKVETPSTLLPTRAPTQGTSSQKGAIDVLKQHALTISPLSQNERTVRTTLIAQASKQTGYITTQPTFALVYLRDEDIFQARLFGGDLAKAKKDVLAWLTARGLKESSLCKLPLFYYVNAHLLPTGEKFDPIPEQCRS